MITDHACEETTLGKTITRKIRDSNIWTRIRLGIVPVLTSQTGKPHSSWGIRKSTEQGLTAVGG